MFPGEIRSILEKTTTVRWSGPRRAWFQNLLSLAASNTTLVVSIRRPFKLADLLQYRRMHHCIVVLRDAILDPELYGPISPSEYHRINWKVVGYYKPKDIDKLTAIQLLNGRRFGSERLWSELLNASPYAR
jgi:hypothetical protein